MHLHVRTPNGDQIFYLYTKMSTSNGHVIMKCIVHILVKNVLNVIYIIN